MKIIFFMSDKWVKQARVLHYTRLERRARDKHSSLLGPNKRAVCKLQMSQIN
jgi:hypothetical protein